MRASSRHSSSTPPPTMPLPPKMTTFMRRSALSSPRCGQIDLVRPCIPLDGFDHGFGELRHDVSEEACVLRDDLYHRVGHQLRIQAILFITKDPIEEAL